MRSLRRAASLGFLVGASACVAPTDASDRFVVRIEPVGELMVGDSTQLVATLIGTVDPVVRNTRFRYESDDATIAQVRPDGSLIAANPGTTTVTVTSVTAVQARSAELRVTVRPAVYIDSVRPATVKYGADVTVYGRGLDPAGGALVASVDGVPLPVLAYAPSDPAAPARQGALRIRIAPPLRTDSAGDGTVNFAITGPRGIASADLPLRVIEKDIFESDELAPTPLGVITAREEWIGLALEPGDTISSADWYTFTTTSPGDWTVKLVWGQTTSDFASLVGIPAADVGALAAASFFGPAPLIYYTNGASTTGAQALCQGSGLWRKDNFGGPDFPSSIGGAGSSVSGPATTTFTFRGIPAGTHHLIVGFPSGLTQVYDPNVPNSEQFAFIGSDVSFRSFTPTRYDLSIEPGRTSTLPPDAYEPNDVCERSADFLTLGAASIADSVVTLSTDTDLDNDWLRIVTTQPGTLVMDYKLNGVVGSLYGTLINSAAPRDTMREFASGRGGGIAGFTRPAGWDGSLTTCTPNPDVGFNFICPVGEGLTNEVQLGAGSYRLHVGTSRAASYTLRIRWTP